MVGTVLAFDFGLRRIGVAVGESDLETAHPLQAIDACDNHTRFEAIGRLLAEWQPVQAVVGLPAPGHEGHPMNARCQKFARQLQGRFGIDAVLVDESYSSVAAASELVEAGCSAAKHRARLDSVAATAILRTWYASR